VTRVPGIRVRRRLARSSGPGDAGWTLLELLIVLTIVMIIAAMAASSRTNAVSMGREAALRANLQMMRDGIDQFYADTARYPDSLQELVSTGYLRRIPKDPFTNSSATWRTESRPPSLNSGRPDDGVYNVRSGADHVALDGTRVGEW
jgi:general secretion pathway protein G